MLALIAAGTCSSPMKVTSVTAADRKATVAAREAAVAARKAARSSASQMALCQASNTARMEQVGLWEYVIRQSPRRGMRRPGAGGPVRASPAGHLRAA